MTVSAVPGHGAGPLPQREWRCTCACAWPCACPHRVSPGTVHDTAMPRRTRHSCHCQRLCLSPRTHGSPGPSSSAERGRQPVCGEQAEGEGGPFGEGGFWAGTQRRMWGQQAGEGWGRGHLRAAERHRGVEGAPRRPGCALSEDTERQWKRLISPFNSRATAGGLLVRPSVRSFIHPFRMFVSGCPAGWSERRALGWSACV